MGTERLVRIVRNDIEQLKQSATKGQIDKAISRGINYAIKKTRTRMKKAVQEEYNLPASAVVNSNNDGSIQAKPARQGMLCGTVSADIGAESLAHFRPTQYKDVINTGWRHKRGGEGGGFDKIHRRGAGYVTTRNLKRNTHKSGVYVTIVKDKGTMCLPSAFILFKGTSPIVMARGKYQGKGKTHDFEFGNFPSKNNPKKAMINKLNAKSVYWGVLHPTSVAKWEPLTEKEFLDEAARQLELLTSGQIT